ncbi:MAG: hypothetical protein OER21_08810 [Gemmatimonadota bacterium]|nr:hypothetical protein [Gemmatimonadota bacterium]
MRAPVGRTLLLLVLAACPGSGEGLDENGNPIGPPGPPADSVTLSADVQPILTANCALSNCHAGTRPVLDQNLSAGLTFSNTVNVPAQQVPALRRVRPFLPDSSYLVHKIQGTHATVGGSGGRMPLGGVPLTSAEIQTIRSWIAAGAPNN